MTMCWTAFLCHMLPPWSATQTYEQVGQSNVNQSQTQMNLPFFLLIQRRYSVTSHTQTHAHTLMHMCTHTQAHMYMHTHAHTQTPLHKAEYHMVYVYAYMCMCVCVCIGAHRSEEHSTCLPQSISTLGCTLPASSSMFSRAVVGLNYNHRLYGAA